jgi:hypothetical protein
VTTLLLRLLLLLLKLLTPEMESEERLRPPSTRPGKWPPPEPWLLVESGDVTKDVEGEMPVGEDMCGIEAKKDVRRRWRESREVVDG